MPLHTKKPGLITFILPFCRLNYRIRRISACQQFVGYYTYSLVVCTIDFSFYLMGNFSQQRILRHLNFMDSIAVAMAAMIFISTLLEVLHQFTSERYIYQLMSA